jgi:hypothetical protein
MTEKPDIKVTIQCPQLGNGTSQIHILSVDWERRRDNPGEWRAYMGQAICNCLDMISDSNEAYELASNRIKRAFQRMREAGIITSQVTVMRDVYQALVNEGCRQDSVDDQTFIELMTCNGPTKILSTT